MTDKMFADLVCRGLIEVCAGLVKVIRAFERRYGIPEHKIPAMEKDPPQAQIPE